MAGRSVKNEVRRREHFAALVASADTTKKVLLAYCQWLTASAWAAGTVDAAIDHVWSRIKEQDPAAETALKEARQR